MAGEQARILQMGMVARSPEGHAAKGMAIKGREDLWIDIQANTFRNWVNEHLRGTRPEVRDLTTDLCDGTRLCALVEILQKKRIRPAWIQRPANQHHYLENVSAALGAVAADGVKLVNIGNVDIVNGNLKLILGLIWSLIVRYQIGRSKFPPKKLMMAWLKAVLPECRVGNFTTDWNSGVNLSALLEYCQPGLFPHWRTLDPGDSVANCRTAMELARQHFQIPLILEPEYLASPFLDELSGMTYLSYFMKEDSPGVRATLRWVNSQLKDTPVTNFTRDWNNGQVLCSLVRSLGGPVPGYQHLSLERSSWEDNLNKGILGGSKLGVEPILKARDMADKNVEHLGVMAYAAHFQWLKPRKSPGDRMAVSCDLHTTPVNRPAHFRLEMSREVDPREVTAEVVGPPGTTECRISLAGNKGTFTPTHVGMHQLIVYNEGEKVGGSPINVRVTPELSKISFPGMDPCAIGSIVEVLINSNGAPSSEISVQARSPTGRSLSCPVQETDGVYTATFQPDEAGEWNIAVTHGGEHIQGGPFVCFVFNPNGVKLRGLDVPATPGQPFSFTMDTSTTGGLGDVVLDVVHSGHSVSHHKELLGGELYKVTFTPHTSGKYRIYVYFNGTDVRGSPFSVRVGSSGQRSREKSNSPITRNLTSQQYVSSASYSSPEDSRWSRRQTGSPHHLVTESRSSMERLQLSDERGGSPARMVNGRGPSPLYPRERVSPVTKKISESRSPSQSPTAFKQSVNVRRGSVDLLEDRNIVDTSSNVRVSSMLGSSNLRSDSWDAISKTKSLLSFGSLESLANLTNKNQTSRDETTQQSDPHLPAVVSGEALKMLSINRPASVSVELTESANLGDVTVTVTAPSRRNVPVKLFRNRDKVTASFTACEIGEHVIDVRAGDHRVNGAPFRTQAYNAAAIHVGRIPPAVLGQPVEFEIDGAGAGSGNLEILVNGGHVTSYVTSLGEHRFLASFVPHEAISHLVEMRFNKETVPGSPWQVPVMTGAKMAILGEAVRLVASGANATFELSAVGFSRDDIEVNIISPSKRPVTARLLEDKPGEFRVEFTPTEVGSHLVEVSVAGQKLPAGPLVAKVYNSALIRVTDVASGVVGQPCQFRVDASQAGEGQLEISINEGEVPNHVQVVGGGRCLVSFTPEHTKPHLIDIKFNGETVTGCPFVCSVSDTSRVSLTLRNLELIPVNELARFHMGVDGSGSAELAVSVRGPSTELPVKVTGNIHSGFTAEFTPRDVGPHSISVEYNGHPVSGTPFVAKAYDSKRVFVGALPKGSVGKSLQFTVDASQAGEGNLEITISARGHNIPTQVHPQGNARFTVSFVPIEPSDHVISINFNKESVPGSPFLARIQGDSPHQILVSGPSLTAAGVGKTSYFTMSNVAGSVEDIEVNVEGSTPYRLRHY